MDPGYEQALLSRVSELQLKLKQANERIAVLEDAMRTRGSVTAGKTKGAEVGGSCSTLYLIDPYLCASEFPGLQQRHARARAADQQFASRQFRPKICESMQECSPLLFHIFCWGLASISSATSRGGGWPPCVDGGRAIPGLPANLTVGRLSTAQALFSDGPKAQHLTINRCFGCLVWQCGVNLQRF